MERIDILLLTVSDVDHPIVGTTRLQKILFLIEKESNVKIDGEDFDFKAHLFGPASDKIYDDLNFLENLGYIEKSGGEETTNKLDINNIESYDANSFLSGSNVESFDNDDPFIENENNEDDLKIYKITKKGLIYLQKKGLDTSIEGRTIKQIVKKYSKNSLLGLLQYVYAKYEEYTSNSIIKDKI